VPSAGATFDCGRCVLFCLHCMGTFTCISDLLMPSWQTFILDNCCLNTRMIVASFNFTPAVSFIIRNNTIQSDIFSFSYSSGSKMTLACASSSSILHLSFCLLQSIPFRSPLISASSQHGDHHLVLPCEEHFEAIPILYFACRSSCSCRPIVHHPFQSANSLLQASNGGDITRPGSKPFLALIPPPPHHIVECGASLPGPLLPKTF